MLRLKDRRCTIPGLFRSPPQYGKFISISFDDLCRNIALANNIKNDDVLKDIVDNYNASILTYGEKKSFVDETIPKIAEQGRWMVHEIDSSKLIHGDFHYNPSLIFIDGHYVLFYRLDTNGEACICCVKLDDDFQPIKDTNKHIKLPGLNKPVVKFEDPRVSIINGKIMMSLCRWAGSWKMYNERKAAIEVAPHQVLVELNRDFEVVKEYPLKYGGNNTDEWQKNWIFFGENGRLYFIYSHSPFIVCEVTDNGVVEICNKKWNCPYDDYVKGGSPPVRIKDKWITFWHGHQPRWNGNTGTGRRYNMGSLVFDNNFNVTDFAVPFVKASELDPGLPWCPLVFFPGSGIFKDDKFLIAYGLHDWHCGIMEIEYSEVQKYLRPVVS